MNRRGFFGGLGLLAAFGVTPVIAISTESRAEALRAGRRKVLTRTTTGVGELVRHNPTVWNLPVDAVLVEEWTDPLSDVRYLKWAHESFREMPVGCVYEVVTDRTHPYEYREDVALPANYPLGPRGEYGPVGQGGCSRGAVGPVRPPGDTGTIVPRASDQDALSFWWKP